MLVNLRVFPVLSIAPAELIFTVVTLPPSGVSWTMANISPEACMILGWGLVLLPSKFTVFPVLSINPVESMSTVVIILLCNNGNSVLSPS